MTLSERIKQVQQDLSQLTQTIADTALKHKLNMLVEALSHIALDASPDEMTTSVSTAAELKNGCYVFPNQKSFYCPSCFDRDGTKAVTTRINSKLRICSVCKTSIK